MYIKNRHIKNKKDDNILHTHTHIRAREGLTL